MSSRIENLAKPVRAVRDAARAVVDVLEPYLIFHEFGFAGVEPAELRGKVLYWQYPSAEGHLMFLDVLEMISPKVHLAVAERHRDYVLEHLRNISFDTKTGGFRAWEGTRKFRESPPTVSASADGINLTRHFVGVNDGQQPLGYNDAAVLLGQERVDRVIEFVKQSQDLKTGGFHHDPEMNTTQLGRPSIWNTSHALDLLWNLEQRDFDREAVRNFLLACECSVSDSPNDSVIGFRESPSKYDSPGPSSGSTAFALKLLESLGEQDWIKGHREGYIAFLRLCRSVNKKGQGGFSYMPGGEPFSLYTNATLASMDVLGVDIDDLVPDANGRQRLVDFYAALCQSREKERLLFGFAPGWAPNSYTMRNTMYTLGSLALRHEDFRGLFVKIFGDTVRVVDGMYAFALTAERAKELGLLEKYST